mmetsp:Transcript_58634/g.119326  ORF Transcript_58634/g.119326 Transcript_58634/m.119326 type:complete len:511 (-) Transcript_58634:90-1622(-)
MMSSTVADVVNQLGMELVIFVVTLGFAFLIRGLPWKPWKQQEDRKQAAVREVLAPSRPTSRSNLPPVSQKSPSSNTSSRGRAAPASGEWGQGVRSGFAAQQAYPATQGRRAVASSRGRALWQLVDEIVDGMKEQQSLKFASKALSLYDELKANIQQENLRLVDVLRQSRHPAVEFYTTLVHCTIRAGKHQLVTTIIEDMIAQGISRSLIFYESTMKQLAGQKQYHLALAVYDYLAADGLEPSAVTCSCLIGFAAEVGEFQRAVSFFERLSKTTTPSIRACMTVLRVHAKRQDWAASVATLREMQRRGVVLDSLALNVTLATGVAADQLEAVQKLVAEGDTCQPPISDVVSYNTLLKGCAQRGDADAAVGALKAMRGRGLRPNAITYNTAMDVAVRAGRNELAWGFLKEMREAKLYPDKFSCSILIKGLAKSPGADYILAALDLLREVDTALDLTLKSTLYQTLLDAANVCKPADESPVLPAKVFAQMRLHHVAPTAAVQRMVVQALPSEN